MKYVLKEDKRKVIIMLEEDKISGSQGDELKGLLLEMNQKGFKEIELDLGKVKSMDSCAIGKILFFYKKLIEDKGTLKIISVTSQLKEILVLLKLNELFQLK